MSPPAAVLIDRSQFPAAVHADLVSSLQARQINHKFHYLSYRQAEKWLALHEAYSPARKDPDCSAVYDRAFLATGKLAIVEMIGLGCGGGQKDARLLAKFGRRKPTYTPVDVSLPLVLTAGERALEIIPQEHIRPGIICDLAAADLQQLFPLNATNPAAAAKKRRRADYRLVTLFGMLPNFEPNTIIPRISAILGTRDYLLCSANLAPGVDYAKGVKAILPQYDNPLTNDWLLTFPSDLGIDPGSGVMEWAIEPSAGLWRVIASFRFTQDVRITYSGEQFAFSQGEKIRLFFSYRYTPYLLEKLLGEQAIEIEEQWITRSGEEGVFLCRKA